MLGEARRQGAFVVDVLGGEVALQVTGGGGWV